MNKEEIISQRGEIINKFINIEWIINAIISQWYMSKVEKEFVLEVLYDEYFSFALKRRIIEKIFSKRAPSKLRPKLRSMLNSLNRLNSIRNYFAHCTESMTLSNIDGEYIPDPKNHDRHLDFQALYDEFMAKEKEVNKYFYDLFSSIGGKSIIDKVKKERDELKAKQKKIREVLENP